MIETNQPSLRKYNCLFLPGMPGKVKQFALFDEIEKTGGKLHWLTYPGTYTEQANSQFTIEASKRAVEAAIYDLSKQPEPFIIVGYSFGTYLLTLLNLSPYKNLLSVSLFSPLRGLDTSSIDERFINTIDRLIGEGTISADLSYWQKITQTPAANYNTTLKKLASLECSVVFAYSTQDSVIQPQLTTQFITHFRQEHGFGSLLPFISETGGHPMDTYYNQAIANYFRTLEIYLDIEKIVGINIAAYLWGSSLNYNYATKESDIDLLVFADNHMRHYKELNDYVNVYNSEHSTTFDLSINDKDDLKSTEIYRYNRGQIITNELIHNYLPIKKIDFAPLLESKALIDDCYNASKILLGESKKILFKCDVDNPRSRKIIKYVVNVFIYHLYIKGLENINLNDIESYVDENASYTSIIMRALHLKRTNYEDLTLDDLYSAVQTIEFILELDSEIIEK